MNKTCEKCGSPMDDYRTIRAEYDYKGKSFYVDIKVLRCSKCKNEIDLNEEERRRAKRRYELSIDGFLTDKDIKRIRKKLGLTQQKMAEILGVGVKTFTRYENLTVRPSKAMDNLLRILDQHPEMMEVLAGK